MTLAPREQEVRAHVYRTFVERGFPPSAAETAEALDLPVDAVQGAYEGLHAQHALVLRHGDRSRVRVAHPLSAYPTPFWVTTPRGAWWGNCIWDGLAIPAMLRTDARIETRSGARGQPLVVEVAGGKLHGGGLVYLPLPASRWWDDIDYTCGHILLFAAPEEVDRWVAATGNPAGERVPLATMWRLAQAWYGDRMDPAWQPRAPAEAQAILDRHGLTGPFWRLHP